MRQHRVRTGRISTLAAVMVASISMLAASCTNPSPPGGRQMIFEATKIDTVSFVGDFPTTFFDSDAAEEPYLAHLGLRLKLNEPIAISTFVSSTYLNDGAFIGKTTAGSSLDITPGDGAQFSGIQLPDVFDLANGAPFEILGSVEFLMERDQLIPLGLPQLLQAVSVTINAALPTILANQGLPSDAQGIVTFLGNILPSVFGVIASAIGLALGNLAGGDQLLGVSPDIFIAVGGTLAGIIQGALPSLLSLVNAVLAQQNPNPFPNGLPFTIGVVGQGVRTRYGTAPGTSVYDVLYHWRDV